MRKKIWIYYFITFRKKKKKGGEKYVKMYSLHTVLKFMEILSQWSKGGIHNANIPYGIWDIILISRIHMKEKGKSRRENFGDFATFLGI